MAHILIGEEPVITFEYLQFKPKYWDEGLSLYILEKYGDKKRIENEDVEKVLMSCFEYFVKLFKELVLRQKSEIFFQCVFLLHEASLKLHIESLKGYELPREIKGDFPRYRRVLKLILEQSCDIELTTKGSVDKKGIIETIQELYYLGAHIYDFAEEIALMKMINKVYYTEFENGIFSFGWQDNYEKLYNELLSMFNADYKDSFFEDKINEEFLNTIETSFNINYTTAIDLIFSIKECFSDDTCQTIEPYILPINLMNRCKISKENANLFYRGLTIDRENKLSIEDTLLKPHSVSRYMFRPILVYKVDGIDRALVGEMKMVESIMLLSSATQWNTMQEEWASNQEMRKFRDKKSQEHDRLLEDKIQEILENNKHPFCRNITSFKQNKGSNIRIDIPKVGEIDFIIINKDTRKIFIADTKYNKTRYDAVGYRMDHSNFGGYEIKLELKTNWLKANLQILQEHLSIMHDIKYSILDFEIIPIFILNTPTFYMLNGKYKAITFNRIKEYITGEWNFPSITLTDNVNNLKYTYNHPYFKNTPVIEPI